MSRGWGHGGAGRAGLRFLAPVLLVLSACTGGDGPDTEESRDALDGPDRTLAWSVEPLFEVGGMEAPEWASFGEGTAVAFDELGRLYILDGQGKRVTVVDTAGGLLRTVGSPGEGPGELRFPRGMVVHPDGAVTILDPGHGGFVVYGPDGAYRGTRAVEAGAVGLPEGPLVRHPSGAILARGAAADAGAGVVDPTLPPPERDVVLYRDGEGGAHRVLFRAWIPPNPVSRPLTPEETGGYRVALPPIMAFHPDLRVAALPDGRVAVVDSFAWQVELVDTSGGVVGVLERPLEPLEVTPALRAAERARRLRELAADPPRMVLSDGSGATAAAPTDPVRRLHEARIDAMGVHDRIPVVAGLAADPLGRLWVERHSGVPGEAGPIDVVFPDGRYLGTIPPESVRIPAAFGPGGRVALVAEDELGVPVIRVGRLTGEGAGRPAGASR